MSVYRISTYGSTTHLNYCGTLDDIPITMLKSTYEGDIHGVCISDEKNIFMLTHTDNDFPENYKNSSLPVNETLQKYFPGSKFKGDVLIVKTKSYYDDTIVKWSPDILKKYECEFDDENVRYSFTERE